MLGVWKDLQCQQLFPVWECHRYICSCKCDETWICLASLAVKIGIRGRKQTGGTCRSTTCVVNGKIYIRLDSIFHVNDGCFRLIYKSSSATAFTCKRAQSLGFWEFANLLKIWDDEHHRILLRQYINTKLTILWYCYNMLLHIKWIVL